MDTGEFMAISTAQEAEKITIAQWTRRAAALSEQLEGTIRAMHNNYHGAGRTYAPARDDWRSCSYASCRNAKLTLDATWDEYK